MKTVAMIAAAVAVLSMTSIATPTPAEAGWCIEACGLKRVPRQQPRSSTVTCTTQSYGGNRQTVCTRN